MRMRAWGTDHEGLCCHQDGSIWGAKIVQSRSNAVGVSKPRA